MDLGDYAPLIAVAIAPIAVPIIRYFLKLANAGLKRIWPDGPLKDRLFREL